MRMCYCPLSRRYSSVFHASCAQLRISLCFCPLSRRSTASSICASEIELQCVLIHKEKLKPFTSSSVLNLHLQVIHLKTPSYGQRYSCNWSDLFMEYVDRKKGCRSTCARTNLVEMGLVGSWKGNCCRCNQNQSNSLSDAANSIGDMLTMQMPLVRQI